MEGRHGVVGFLGRLGYVEDTGLYYFLSRCVVSVLAFALLPRTVLFSPPLSYPRLQGFRASKLVLMGAVDWDQSSGLCGLHLWLWLCPWTEVVIT